MLGAYNRLVAPAQRGSAAPGSRSTRRCSAAARRWRPWWRRCARPWSAKARRLTPCCSAQAAGGGRGRRACGRGRWWPTARQALVLAEAAAGRSQRPRAGPAGPAGRAARRRGGGAAGGGAARGRAAAGLRAPAVQRCGAGLQRRGRASSRPAADAPVRLRHRRAACSGLRPPAVSRVAELRGQPLGRPAGRRRRPSRARSACTPRGTAWRHVRCRCGSRSASRRAGGSSTPARYSVDRCWLMLGWVVSISSSSCETFFSRLAQRADDLQPDRRGQQPEQLGGRREDLVRFAGERRRRLRGRPAHPAAISCAYPFIRRQ